MSRFGASGIPYCRPGRPGWPRRAADASSSWLYQMTTRYGGHRLCRCGPWTNRLQNVPSKLGVTSRDELARVLRG